MTNEILVKICAGLPLDPLPPAKATRNPQLPHAPNRKPTLNKDERKVNLFLRRSIVSRIFLEIVGD